MRSATPGRPLRLAAHVRACESDGQVILLDLRRNRYLGVEGFRSHGLATEVEGWPTSRDRADTCAPSTGLGALKERLLAQGLLTHEALERTPEAALPEATSSLDFEDGVTGSDIGVRRLGRFLRSAALASIWIRCRSLHAIVTAVENRRERMQVRKSDGGSLDAMRRGAATYDRLRPFVFTAHEKCLHDSLALVGFLAAEGVFPRWVIGVKTRPFGAHSWVQSGGVVLNDQHENVRHFRPILVV